MTGRPSDRDGEPSPFASSSFEERLAASSLMSCRWTQDNLVTSYPALLYNGAVERPIGVESLEPLLLEFAKLRPLRGVGAGHMGVFTWDIACEGDTGAFMLQLPLVLDAPGVRGRSKRDVPRQNHTHLRSFREQGLTRFGVEPEAFTLLGGLVPAATFAALPDHHALTFERGSLQVEVVEAERSWVVPLGPALTAELLAEMVAILVYYYDSTLDGGTAITDVFVNDGDFVVKRRADGTFDLRLTAARQRESGIGPDLLLLYLIQMMAYEDWEVGDDLVGLPVLISNPSVAFEGLVRGLRYRCLDQGVPEREGRREAFGWIEQFGHSLEGRSYRPWVDRFLAGQLPLRFGHDPREHWWRLAPLDTKLGLLELTARKYPDSAATASAKVMRELVERLACEIGCVSADRNEIRVNDQSPDELASLLAEAQIPRAAQASVLESILTHWPHKNLEHLLARVPGAGRLRRMKSRLAFGHVVSQAIEGTIKSLPARNESRRPSRVLANPELFGELWLPPSLYPEAIQTFSTFEGYMDQSLHDVNWGYYARHVVIGSQGHFATHPESYSPDYGRWIARLAFKAWRDMLAHGELAETDAFPIVEFGAGNGRLARDVLDAIASAPDPEHAADPGWHSFRARARYHVYEMSESLRAKQRQLLGAAACVADGDARRPQATLARDFPDGLRGFLVTNEVPDAFGVHKVVLTADGQAFAALVVPRVERQAFQSFAAPLVARIESSDQRLRARFGFQANPNDCYLEAETHALLMHALAALPVSQRATLLGHLWFEEAYVPASLLTSLARHLAANAEEYAAALAAEDSGVVAYVNVHASRFIQELGAAFHAGFVVTIDYGDTTWGLIQGARRGDFPFRIYGEWQDYVPRPNDPYAQPGMQDLTADINFSDLARAGERAGLTLVHYGPERDVAGDELPELIDAAAERNSIAKFLGNPVFKILILGTRSSAAFAGPWLSPLPLTHPPQALPNSRRARLEALRAQLARLA